MTTFPKKIQFVSCDSIVELIEENIPQSSKGKKQVVTINTAKYRYTFVPQIKSKEPSKKLGTTVEYTIEYLNRLDSFKLIIF